MTDQNTNGGRPRSANGFIDMVVLGNAGNDPEMRYTPSGTAVTNFSLAVNCACRATTSGSSKLSGSS
jgi:single-strand DNA-binding protein